MIQRVTDLPSFPAQLWGHYQIISQHVMVTLVTQSISDASKSFTISGWGWIRGPGTKLSCPTAVWPCQERSLSNVLGASPALLPPGLPSFPSLGSNPADPSKDEAPVGHRVTGHSRFTWVFYTLLWLGGFPLLWSWFPNPSQLILSTVFNQPWFQRIFLRLVGLSHN